MGGESSGMVGFDLGPLLQGQVRTAKHKSADKLLIIGFRGFDALSLRWIQFASVFRCARSSFIMELSCFNTSSLHTFLFLRYYFLYLSIIWTLI